MPRLLKTLTEYVATIRKRETYFMVFNTVYNDLYAFKNEPNSEENAEYGIFGYLNEKCVNNIARDEFINFMKDKFPNTQIHEVFDMVSPGYLIYPYLGTIAIDCEKDDEVYNAICKKYEDKLGNPLSKDAVFWSISYEIALKNYNEVKQMWDDELAD
ncbi:hypothetical protein [Arcobacter porcinus]|uniref:Uncharacterized protein n=1 Tax=Arcobacter porcinus TaxID=1935204 RepID=A0A5C2HJX5_9BACT|nr:hypothetical protein [Arcobacter porcinus]OCL89475.1 hypothetical protein AAX27_01898 [Aliarcobacter thereius]QEP41040.1 hypothetical protein APORC_1457 [Arcobacter porcinus]